LLSEPLVLSISGCLLQVYRRMLQGRSFETLI
jgi:hypothetical protein